MLYFVKMCVICDVRITEFMKICGFAICGLAHLKYLRICSSGMSLKMLLAIPLKDTQLHRLESEPEFKNF